MLRIGNAERRLSILARTYCTGTASLSTALCLMMLCPLGPQLQTTGGGDSSRIRHRKQGVGLWWQVVGSGPGASEKVTNFDFQLPSVPDSVDHAATREFKGFHFPTGEGAVAKAMQCTSLAALRDTQTLQLSLHSHLKVSLTEPIAACRYVLRSCGRCGLLHGITAPISTCLLLLGKLVVVCRA